MGIKMIFDDGAGIRDCNRGIRIPEYRDSDIFMFPKSRDCHVVIPSFLGSKYIFYSRLYRQIKHISESQTTIVPSVTSGDRHPSA